AVGIAATAAILTIVSAILFRPLPYHDPDRLVMVWSENKQLGWERERMSFPEFWEWQRSGIFEHVLGFIPHMPTITFPGEPERVHTPLLTGGALSMLGVTPLVGRAFTPDEEMPNGSKAVILGYSIWMRRYGGDPTVVGKTIDFDDVPHQIVGV